MVLLQVTHSASRVAASCFVPTRRGDTTCTQRKRHQWSPSYRCDVTGGGAEQQVDDRRILRIQFTSARVQLLLRVRQIVVIVEVEDLHQFLLSIGIRLHLTHRSASVQN